MGEQEVVADLEAGEKALSWLKAAFEKIAADADGAVSKQELAAISQKDLVEEVGEAMGKWIADAGFNPLWNSFEQLDTNKGGAVSWPEFEAHVRSIAQEVEVVVVDAVKTQRCWACC